mgnify:CR=1 FL=1
MSFTELDTILNSGFSNFIFQTNDSSKHVIRAGLAHSAENTISFRGYDEVQHFRCIAEAYCNCLSEEDGTLLTSFWHLVLPSITGRTALDIESHWDVLREVELAVRACALGGLVYGVTVPMHRSVWPLPVNGEVIACWGGLSGPEPLRLYLVVEVLLRSMGDLTDIEGFTEAGVVEMVELDLVLLCHGYFADQLSFLRHLGCVHSDAHPRNILFDVGLNGHMVFTWCDFGKPSSHTAQDGSVQFQVSIREFLACVSQLAGGLGYSRTVHLTHTISTAVANVDILSEVGLAAVVQVVVDEVHSAFTAAEVNALRTRIGG